MMDNLSENLMSSLAWKFKHGNYMTQICDGAIGPHHKRPTKCNHEYNQNYIRQINNRVSLANPLAEMPTSPIVRKTELQLVDDYFEYDDDYLERDPYQIKPLKINTNYAHASNVNRKRLDDVGLEKFKQTVKNRCKRDKYQMKCKNRAKDRRHDRAEKCELHDMWIDNDTYRGPTNRECMAGWHEVCHCERCWRAKNPTYRDDDSGGCDSYDDWDDHIHESVENPIDAMIW